MSAEQTTPRTVEESGARWSKRCRICGWFLSRRGWCANEVPVQGGWLREHR